MKLCIVGTGYVGLVSAACFAEMGNSVTCIDVNKDVVARLNAGSVHIFEPGLEPMVRRSHADGRLKFTTSLAEGLVGADCAFICVGTPPGEDGSCDLHYVEQVAREIGRTMENDHHHRRTGCPRQEFRLRGGLQPRVPEGRRRHLRLHEA